ncbi:PAS domain-containing protein [Nocardioides sp. Y6]|uniref:histidine kinase n=1 Tax=Nocardioides malaquae TaxID=2773426 RepID=A0ABR9RRC7_9ACTN|nr:ATP-binding protein [Nocardioides malaquae]MBE7323700.1 PAS domain-containing protein [Nocardioides malaquae]
MTRTHSGWTPAWAATMVALALGSAHLSLATAPEGSITATLWPAVGFGIVALALSPTRWWPALVVALGACTASAAAVQAPGPVAYMAVFVVLSMGESLAGAVVLRLRRAPDEVQLRSQEDAIRVVVASLTAATVSGAGSALYAAVEGSREAREIFVAIFPSHLASALVVALLVLSLRSPRRRTSRVEVGLQTTLLALALWTIFASGQHPALSPFPLILLIWAAYRFGLRTLAWQMFATAVIVGLIAATGTSPFQTLDGQVMSTQMVATLVQTYLLCMVLICLPVAVGVHTSDLLQRQLRASQHLSDITLATTACLILVTDIRGTVLRANPAVGKVLGHDIDAVVGHPVWETITSVPDRAAVRQLFASGDGRDIPRQLDGRVHDVWGREHRMVWTSGIVHEDGTPAHVVLTGLDVTAERTAAGLMEHLLSAALDTAIIGTDPQGTITLFNTGAQSMLGRPSSEAVGTPFTDLLDPDALERWTHAQQEATPFQSLVDHVVGEPPQDWGWRTSPEPDAPLRRVSMSLTRVTDHSNALIGYLCIGTDMTDIHATAELLVSALEKERQVVGHLKDLDTAKDQFVTTVSHELRTPVATIVGYGEMLAEGDLGELSGPQAKALTAIVRNGERLVGLIDNLLALGGLAADGPQWDRDPVDLREVVREVQVDTAALLENRVLNVSFDVPSTAVPVMGERATLVLALNNVVANAVKFTEDGGQVRCLLDVVDGQARILVDDTGLGIPLDEQQYLFQRFWRSSTSQQREIQGTGLGLSTVQTIVRAHGGSVEIESADRRGTTVTVLLPVHESSRSAPTGDRQRVRRD